MPVRAKRKTNSYKKKHYDVLQWLFCQAGIEATGQKGLVKGSPHGML